MKNKFILFYIILFLAVIFMTSCNTSKKDGSQENLPPKESVIRVGLPYKARSFNPQMANDSATLAVARQIYDTLFVLNEDGILENALAENYKVISDNEIIIQIKDGIFFHDGTKLTSADVAKSLNLSLKAPIARVVVGVISSVEDIGNNQIKITHSSNSSLILHNLTHLSTSVIKPISNKSAGEITIIGTGPYIIDKWGNGEQIELVANKKYYAGKPKNTKIVFMTIPENTSRCISLETGEIDIAYDLLPSDINILKNNSNLTSIIKPSYGIDFLGINTDKIKDVQLRTAISLGINRKDISTAVFEGIPESSFSMLSPSVFGFDPNIQINDYNPDKAREIVSSIHHELPLKLSLYIYEEPSRVQMAQVIQSNLKDIGIDLRIVTLEVSSFLQHTANGEQDMLIGLWHMSTGDADFGFFPLLHSSSAGTSGNRSFYNNSNVDNLIELARKENDNNKRLEHYKEIQKIINKDIPLIPLLYKTYIIGLNKNIDGFIFHPSGSHLLYQVEKKN
ncbi:ABC transporter substrate-binding protein [Fusobacterium sp. PH5-44]|uniref:ABC transporter substrate-binding protein n=1 Tax=unclassified Fusobacterium TaxID=2648384 RepID=UPI003D233CF4